MSLAEELARAQTFTGASGAALATLDGDKLIWLGAVGQNPPKAGDRWSLAGSFATLCLGRKTRPQRCDDVEVDGRVDAAFRSLRAKSLALAPVHDQGKVTGILAVFSDNSRAFNGMHAAVLQTEADSLAELVQQARRAAGVKDEEMKPENPPEAPARLEESRPAPAALAPVPAPPEPPKEDALPAENSREREFEALESAFILVPPPVAGPPLASAAETAAPPAGARAQVPEAESPVVRTPPPTPAAFTTPPPAERPTLPGFTPLFAAAAALAKAQSIPTPADVVEAKVRKPVKSAGVPTPPPAPPVVPPPVLAAPRPAAPAAVPTPPPTPAPMPAVKFVPLARPEVKTPPPGSLKPGAPATASASATAGKAAPTESAEDQFLPPAADPFAHYAPVYLHPSQPAVRSVAATSRPDLADLEGVGHKVGGAWRLPVVVAAVAAVALGILWVRTRSQAARSQPAPAVTQSVAAPVDASQPASPPAAPESQVTATPVPAADAAASRTAPAGQAVGGAQEAEQGPGSPPAKAQAVSAEITQPAATVSAPAALEIKTPAPVATPLTSRQQEPAPKTLLSLPAAAPAKLPDLPKPEAPATSALRRISTPVPAQLLHSVPPIYPANARALHLEGVVRLTAKVNAQGRVTDVTWVSGNSFFRGSALSAVRQWRYKPATLDGQPVESTLEIVLKFTPQ